MNIHHSLFSGFLGLATCAGVGMTAFAAEPLILKGHRGAVEALEYSPDGQSLVSVAGREAAVWNPATQRSFVVLALPASHGPHRVSWHPDGKCFAVWGDFPGVHLCHVDTKRVKTVLEGALIARESSSVLFSPDGRLLARSSCGRSARSRSELTPEGTLPGIVDLLDLRSMEVISLDIDQGVSCLRFSEDGKRLFGAGTSGNVVIWNLGSGQRLATAKVAAAMLHSLDTDPQGALLAVGASDGEAILLDAKTSKRKSPLIDPSGRENRSAVVAVAFSPSGRRLVQGGRDGMVKLWNVDSYELIASIVLEHGVRALAFGPQDDILLVADRQGTLNLFDAASLQRIETIIQASAFAMTRRGDVVATGSLTDGKIAVRLAPIDVGKTNGRVQATAAGDSSRPGKLR